MGEAFKVKGFIKLELVNKKDNSVRVVEVPNLITAPGRQLILEQSVGGMLELAGDTFGMVGCSQYLNKSGNTEYTYNANSASRQAFASRNLTNVLLSLGTEVNSLNNNTNMINVHDANLDVADKVLGYANSNLMPVGDGKEGSIDYSKPEYVIDPFTRALRWKYPEGVATGTINCVAMMPAPCVKTNHGDGIAFAKCIDKINAQYANYVAMSTGFLPPGVPGYTANDEILLNFNQDGNSQWKYNIGTGVITSVAPGDPFFVVGNGIDSLYNITDIQYIDGYLYVLDNLNPVQVQYVNPRVSVYNPAAAMARVGRFNCAYKTSYENGKSAKFLYYNSILYVSMYQSKQVVGSAKLWVLSKGANPFFSSAAAAQTDFTSIATIPTGIDVAYAAIGNYGTSYILYVFSRLDGLSDGTFVNAGYKAIGYVFTDMENIGGSIVDIIHGLNPNSIAFSAGTSKGIIRVGFNMFDTATVFGTAYNRVTANKEVYNSGAALDLKTNSKGIWLSLDKWWTNVFSFKVLSTPIVKGTDDILYVSYGYKIDEA